RVVARKQSKWWRRGETKYRCAVFAAAHGTHRSVVGVCRPATTRAFLAHAPWRGVVGGWSRHTNRNNNPHYRLELLMYVDSPAVDLPDIEPDADDLHALAPLPWDEAQAHLEGLLVEASLLIQQDELAAVRNLPTDAGGDTLGVAA